MYLLASRSLINTCKPLRCIQRLPVFGIYKSHFGQPDSLHKPAWINFRFFTMLNQSEGDTYVKREFKSESEEFTRLLGREIAKFCKPGDAVCLYGFVCEAIWLLTISGIWVQEKQYLLKVLCNNLSVMIHSKLHHPLIYWIMYTSHLMEHCELCIYS